MSRDRSTTAEQGQILARNRKARHDYYIMETYEAGLVLSGSEVKSVRAGRVSLKGAFGIIRRGELWLEGMSIAPYESGGYANHQRERPRKLLLHRRQIRSLIGAVEQQGGGASGPVGLALGTALPRRGRRTACRSRRRAQGGRDGAGAEAARPDHRGA